jgi:hypothetical protein
MRSKRIHAVLAALLVLLPALPARAQSEPSESDGEDPPPPRRFAPEPESKLDPQWYGGTVLIVDAASALALVALPPAGVAGYGLGAPAVHVAHGRPGAAAGSLALRLGAVLWAIGLSMPTAECEDTGMNCGSGLEPVAPLLGAIAVDAIFLSWKTPESSRAAAPAVLPAVAFRPGGGTVGLSGRF